jgi:DNA-binding CsgD family transcriptional regulator
MPEQNTILDLVGSVPIGVILVGANRQVISLNRRAREITADGDALAIHNNQLWGTASGQTRKLDKLITEAIRGGRAEAGAMAIFRDSSRLPLWVRVAPLELRCAAVLISDPAWKCTPDFHVLNSLFGLTRTECRLASLLMQGVSLLKAARELKVTDSRARTHLKVLLRKTGARRQSQLTYLLLSSPAPICLAGVQARLAPGLKSAAVLNKNGNKGNKTALAFG